MNKEFKTKALNVLKEDLNIDTVKLLHHKFKESETVSTTNETDPFIIHNTAKLTKSIENFQLIVCLRTISTSY